MLFYAAVVLVALTLLLTLVAVFGPSSAKRHEAEAHFARAQLLAPVAYLFVAVILVIVATAVSRGNRQSDLIVTAARVEAVNLVLNQANQAFAGADYDQKTGHPPLNSENSGCLKVEHVESHTAWQLDTLSLGGSLQDVKERQQTGMRIVGRARRSCRGAHAKVSLEFGRLHKDSTLSEVTVTDASPSQEYSRVEGESTEPSPGTWNTMRIDSLLENWSVGIITVYPYLDEESRFDFTVSYPATRPLGPTMLYFNPRDFGEMELGSFTATVDWPDYYTVIGEPYFVYPTCTTADSVKSPELQPDKVSVAFDSVRSRVRLEVDGPAVKPVTMYYRVARALPPSGDS